MSDVEILGRPFYRPVKQKIQDEQNLFVGIKSKDSTKSPTYTDIVYERDEGDWWWCEDL